MGKGERELHVVDHPQWYAVITLGFTVLLDRLEDQIATDRDRWRESRMSGIRTAAQILETAERVYETLSGRERLQDALAAHYQAVGEAVRLARQAKSAGDRNEERRQIHAAKRALIAMLNLAYDWGCLAIATMPSRSPKVA